MTSSVPSTTTLHNSIPQHLYVLPVLLLEFLALAITRAVLPSLLVDHFGPSVYFVMGLVESVRGVLAFLTCPLFGKISDITGRRVCLFVTVLGTCSPVCVLALLPASVENDELTTVPVDALADVTSGGGGSGSILGGDGSGGVGLTSEIGRPYFSFHGADRIIVFVILLALSGVFSSTFTLTFAYISDVVQEKQERVAAYGLALATFGLSFTIGPIAGGYLASGWEEGGGGDDLTMNYEGQTRVFRGSLVLTIIDLLYIYYVLPESKIRDNNNEGDDDISLSDKIAIMKHELPRRWWSPLDTLKVFSRNRLLATVAKITFLYYTALYAVISTLVLYAARRFKLGPNRLGELMSAFGLCTMIAEVVLVRIIVPAVGEKRAMRLGLMSFALQCVVLGCAYEFWQLFLCVALSLFANLVYPSLTSIVSASVPPESVGEVLGAVNGIKSLTEGIGPLVFGILMTVSEGGVMPGWPYFIAGVLAFAAFIMSQELPDEDDEEYTMDQDLAGDFELKGLLDDHIHLDEDEEESTGAICFDRTGDDDSYISDITITAPMF